MDLLRRIWQRINPLPGRRTLTGRKIKIVSPGDWHYDDCELEPGWEGCWCEHRGAFSHYGGGLKQGWHRKKCPKAGEPWSVYKMKDPLELNTYWTLPPCECRDQGNWGQFVLTLEDGTIHGPAPEPDPDKERQS